MKILGSNFWAIVFLLTLNIPKILSAQTDSTTIDYGNNKNSGNFISINDVKLYYEIYGSGAPLVLIHGNGGNIGYMQPQIEYFSKNYKVIVMDCRGRGKSELGKDSLTYIQMTKDIVGLLDYLRLDSTYIVGRSDGGIIALLVAIYYPSKVKKVVAFAANLTPDTTALYPFFYNQVLEDRRLADEMIAKKDTTKNWKVIQQRNRLMEFQPQISNSDLKKITCPVLVASTDRDIIKEEHTLFIYRNIQKANLCFFTGETHYITKNNPALFNTVIAEFLSEPYAGNELREE
ncbi:MAG TPA: alpha/beta hydrolase [Ignavibacteriaceae bacterium]|nr:alpha/beta hydrolase [Ignavibacteriaceae bacterium]